jgi:heme/copper-type cytochrome/quinol oxidase subunit 3
MAVAAAGAAMRTVRTIDVSGLPVDVVSAAAPLWWGTMGLIVIESTMFAIVIGSYFYVRQNYGAWPPEGTMDPDLWRGGLMIAALAASAVPMWIVDRLTPEGDEASIRLWLAICCVLCVVCLVTRWIEFGAFHCRWDTHAYGSVVWTAIGVHTSHLVASTAETIVMTIDAFMKPIEKKMRLDAKVNSLYWYFVVGWWLVVGGVIYVAPRVL